MIPTRSEFTARALRAMLVAISASSVGTLGYLLGAGLSGSARSLALVAIAVLGAFLTLLTDRPVQY